MPSMPSKLTAVYVIAGIVAILGEEIYVFETCPDTVSKDNWNKKLNAAFKEQKEKNDKKTDKNADDTLYVRLCPKIGDFCDAVGETPHTVTDTTDVRPGAFVNIRLWVNKVRAESKTKNCIGWAASTCTDGRKAFVKMFFEKAPETYKPYCAIVTAVMDHESHFGANALSWDSCNKGEGAAGIFQYDVRSGLNPFPITPKEQFKQFFDTSDPKVPNVDNMGENWQSCKSTIDGASQLKQSEFTEAWKECNEQAGGFGVTLSTKKPHEMPNGKTCDAAKDFKYPEKTCKS